MGQILENAKEGVDRFYVDKGKKILVKISDNTFSKTLKTFNEDGSRGQGEKFLAKTENELIESIHKTFGKKAGDKVRNLVVKLMNL